MLADFWKRNLQPIAIARNVWIALIVAVAIKSLVVPEKHSLYPRYAQTARELVWQCQPTTCYAFQHLPYFGDLLAPFAMLPNRFGGTIWNVMSLLSLLHGLRAFAAEFSDATSRERATVVLMVTTLAIGLGSFWNSQANVLILASLLWGSVFVSQQRFGLASCFLALPGFKLYPWALGMVYAGCFIKRFSLRFVVMVLGLLTLPFLFHPSTQVIERYQTTMRYIAAGVHYDINDFINLRDVINRYGGNVSARTFLVAQAGSGLAIFLVSLAMMHRRQHKLAILHAYLLTTLWFVSFGPSVEWQTLLLAAPTIGWQLAQALSRPLGLRAGMLIGAVMMMGPLQTSILGESVRQQLLDLKLAGLVAIGLFAYQCVHSINELRKRDEHNAQSEPAASEPAQSRLEERKAA